MASEHDPAVDAAWNDLAAATAGIPDEPATVEPGELVDSNGYPTEEALEHLRRFTGTPAEYVTYAESLFVNGAGVHVEDLDGRWDRGMKRVSFVTGGWSGCESVISAIEGSMFSFRFAREWKSGGYWAYEIHASQWDADPSFLGKMWVLAEQNNPDRGMYPERRRTVDTGQLRHIIDLIDNDQMVLARQRLVELTTKAEQVTDV
ncbi:hypothetical protein ACWGJ9_09790 [Curtobacterium citreum]